MFSIFKEAAKRTKYEMYARSYLAENHRFDIGLVGDLRLADLTEEIVTAMKASGREGEQVYTELLVKKLKTMGYI
jgi:hypothetical protein